MSEGARDLIVGLFFVAAGLLMVFVVIPGGIDAPATVPFFFMSPRFWPGVIAAFMAAMGAVVALKGLVQVKFARSGAPGAADGSAEAIHWRGMPYIVAASAFMLLYYWAMQAFGLVAVSMVAIVVFALLYLERRWWLILPVAIVLPLVLYAFFATIANVPIPLGPFRGLI